MWRNKYCRLARLAFILWHASLSSGCESEVMIRMENNSDTPFDTVLVRFPSQQESYGPLPARSRSDYRRIEKAYSYAYIKVTVGENESILQPVDFVGERLLRTGHYTYRLTYDGQKESPHERLGFEFVED